jgi:hypothetical protein
MKLQVYTDPQHGWVKVKRTLLDKLEIADKISRCSYQRGDFVYLEEDCDAGLLINALKVRGIEYSFKTSWTNRSSKIRNYPCYVK